MARLTAAQRKALPTSDFAGPNRTFPVEDADHARAAQMLVGKAPASARKKIKARAAQKLKPSKQVLKGGPKRPDNAPDMSPL